LPALDLAVRVNQDSEQHVEEDEIDDDQVRPEVELKGPAGRSVRHAVPERSWVIADEPEKEGIRRFIEHTHAHTHIHERVRDRESKRETYTHTY